MNPTLNQLISAMHDEGVAPCIVHEYDDDTTFVGYCLPNCKSFDESKWLVKKISKSTQTGTTGTIQSIQYLNGSRKFDQVWTGHDASNKKYRYANESF